MEQATHPSVQNIWRRVAPRAKPEGQPRSGSIQFRRTKAGPILTANYAGWGQLTVEYEDEASGEVALLDLDGSRVHNKKLVRQAAQLGELCRIASSMVTTSAERAMALAFGLKNPVVSWGESYRLHDGITHVRAGITSLNRQGGEDTLTIARFGRAGDLQRDYAAATHNNQPLDIVEPEVLNSAVATFDAFRPVYF